VYLKRVQAGEALEVTDRGHPVALLVPLPKPSTVLERLVAAGRAQPARGHLADLVEMPEGPVSLDGSKALEELREDRF
jgi:antitoxin (DNA-binding transcriptional repressor) of toxin-antitoxin stability system